MNKILAFLTIIFIISCKEDPSNKIIKVINRKDKHIQYQLEIKNKPLFSNDTSKNRYSVYLEENKANTMFDYNFKVKNVPETEKDISIYFLNDTVYYVNAEKRSYSVNELSDNLNKFLLFKNNLRVRDFKDSIDQSIKINTKANNLIEVRKKYENDEERDLKNMQETFIISTKLNQIIDRSLNVDFQNTNQFEECHFSNFDYNTKQNLRRELAEIKKKFTLKKTEVEKPENDISSEKNDYSYKNFKGRIFSENEEKTINEFKNKILILDFWYIQCYPCISSIPGLNKIYEKYADNEDVVLLGVNPKDYDKGQERLGKFIEYNKVKYPIFMTKKEPYGVTAFPTMLIFNKKRELIFYKEGFTEDFENKVIKVVNEALIK